MTSMRRNDVASTSFIRYVPAGSNMKETIKVEKTESEPLCTKGRYLCVLLFTHSSAFLKRKRGGWGGGDKVGRVTSPEKPTIHLGVFIDFIHQNVGHCDRSVYAPF